MVAGWMVAGFVHGVLNTDNFNITGESFDYGPWRFLPYFDPGFTAAYFDQTGRYAYGRQPSAAMWALCRLADCFVPIVDSEVLAETLSSFYSSMERNLARRLRWRLGVEGTDDDASQLSALVFEAAKASQIGWDKLFHELYGGHKPDKFADSAWRNSAELAKLADYASSLLPRQTKTAVQAVRAAPIISLEIDVVERIWAPIATSDDWSEFTQSLQDIRSFGQRLRA